MLYIMYMNSWFIDTTCQQCSWYLVIVLPYVIHLYYYYLEWYMAICPVHPDCHIILFTICMTLGIINAHDEYQYTQCLISIICWPELKTVQSYVRVKVRNKKLEKKKKKITWKQLWGWGGGGGAQLTTLVGTNFGEWAQPTTLHGNNFGERAKLTTLHGNNWGGGGSQPTIVHGKNFGGGGGAQLTTLHRNNQGRGHNPQYYMETIRRRGCTTHNITWKQ